MHGLEERQLVDRDRDRKAGGVADRGEAGRGVDQTHHDPTVHRAGDVDVGRLHELGQLDTRLGDGLGRRVSFWHPRIVRPAAGSTVTGG